MKYNYFYLHAQVMILRDFYNYLVDKSLKPKIKKRVFNDDIDFLIYSGNHMMGVMVVYSMILDL